VTAIVLGVVGDMEATVVLLVSPADAARICTMLGVDADSELGLSALQEIGNILGSSYVNALAGMTGLNVEPTPPSAATDMLAAIVASVLAERAGGVDTTLMLDSALVIEGENCTISFMLVPDRGAVELMLAGLGLA
jgi:chemotaxis protein CheC